MNTRNRTRFWPIRQILKYIEQAVHCTTSIWYETTSDLFSMQIVSVMHVLVFAEIRCHLSHFCVELDVYMFLLPKQNSMLEKNKQVYKQWRRYRSSYSKLRTHEKKKIQGKAQVMHHVNIHSLIIFIFIFIYISLLIITVQWFVVNVQFLKIFHALLI